MTDRIALFLGLVLALAIGIDLWANEGAVLAFLARKFVDLVEWTSFWR
ncbi:MAG: hypothetical protein HC844_08405 [Tabrizicola sp.]|nr:hypothetical protein [Tabrizicola sp.]